MTIDLKLTMIENMVDCLSISIGSIQFVNGKLDSAELAFITNGLEKIKTLAEDAKNEMC